MDAFNSRGVTTMTDVYVPPGRGFGFVRFATGEEADAAAHICTDLHIRGSPVDLKLSNQEKNKSASGGPAPAFAWKGCGGAPAGGPFHPQMENYTYGAHSYGMPHSGNPMPQQISVKVGNLPAGTVSDDLWAAFGSRGINDMTDVYVPAGKNFGFLRFSHLSAAHIALRCSGMNVNGSYISCEMAEGDKRSATEMAGAPVAAAPYSAAPYSAAKPEVVQIGDSEVSIKVGNLPPHATPEEICAAFAEQGIDNMSDCYIPQGRLFGFVRFMSLAEGRFALQKDVYVRGNRLELEPAVGSKRNSGQAQMGGAPHNNTPPPKVARTMPPAVESFVMAPTPEQYPSTSPDAPSVKAVQGF